MNKSYPMAMVKTPGEVEFEDRPVPELSAGQVLIKTRAVSICGSDVHTFSRVSLMSGRAVLTRSLTLMKPAASRPL